MGDTAKQSGRSSPRNLQSKPPANTPITDAQLKQLVVDIKNQNDAILQNQERCLERMEIHSADILELKKDNQTLKKRVGLLEEQMIQMDQYSRKNVMIVTGLEFDEDEAQHRLESTLCGMFNDITGKKGSLGLSLSDFVAIHRNGRKLRKGRPPSVTVKFLRYFDKDSLFAKHLVQARKTKYPGIVFHHCLCPGLIEVQSLLTAHPRVKFAIYEGGNRFFSVCVKDQARGSDFFLNRIQNIEHFEAELRDH